MIISTCGFGSTGSSAVCDYLMECDGFFNFDAVEFTLSTMVDGLEDLEYHLMKNYSRLSSGNYAIQRFYKAVKDCSREWANETRVSRKSIMQRTEQYLDEIVQLRFIGNSPKIDKPHIEWFRRWVGISILHQRLIPYFEKKGWLKHNINYYPLDNINASIQPSNFYEATQKYVSDLLKLLGCPEDKNIILDQAFVGNNPSKSFLFFNDPYAIVVDRDPRDLYIFAKKVLLSRGRFMPTEDVHSFIKYYKMLRDNQPYKISSDRVLVINFESLVYEYEKTAKLIDEFVGTTNTNRKSIFDPSISIANTNLIQRYPEFESDVHEIEMQLTDYLFPFDKYPYNHSDSLKKMFFGKSPLNKQ